MWFKINYSLPKPVYEQIKDRIKDLILSGKIIEGEYLPSIRVLAESIKVNLNTVARAYRELEFEKIITAKKGKGYVVNKINEELIEVEIFNELKIILNRIKRSGIDKEKIINFIEEYLEGDSK
ncbi:GntR family transcriptional regulator [Tepiditoga spiralis]|uniref:GntR family transcriptional regulator n=1 Tax=Tepiditoga spiralis TaxID=2108365 RepID=A0A7G1GB04_9BACT|nr:GntR family transcriptional regulator [Tepiditoga spiralis]BBE31472.1 GntR family transcriptional regulator [Tepiditoga spiralis]